MQAASSHRLTNVPGLVPSMKWRAPLLETGAAAVMFEILYMYGNVWWYTDMICRDSEICLHLICPHKPAALWVALVWRLWKTEASFFLDDPTLGGQLCHETKRRVHAARANYSQERPQRGLVLGNVLKRIEQILIDFKRLVSTVFLLCNKKVYGRVPLQLGLELWATRLKWNTQWICSVKYGRRLLLECKSFQAQNENKRNAFEINPPKMTLRSPTWWCAS